MADDIRDVKIPLQATAGGDFAVVTGDEFIHQRIQLGYGTQPGQFHDLPEWGADLEFELGTKKTPGRLQRLKNRADRFLQDLPQVEEHLVTVDAPDSLTTVVNTLVKYDGRETQLPEFEIA